MTWDQFIEIVNMPSMLVIISCLTFLSTFGLLCLINLIKGKL